MFCRYSKLKHAVWPILYFTPKINALKFTEGGSIIRKGFFLGASGCKPQNQKSSFRLDKRLYPVNCKVCLLFLLHHRQSNKYRNLYFNVAVKVSVDLTDKRFRGPMSDTDHIQNDIVNVEMP